jgi:hypothetical protein
VPRSVVYRKWREWRPRGSRLRAWATPAGAVVAATVITLVALSFVSAVYPAPVSQTLKYELTRSGMGISFGVTSPAPMAVGQPVTLTWFYLGKYPYAPSNSSVYNPIVRIRAQHATGAIVVDLTDISWGAGTGGPLGGPSIYAPAGSLPGRMGGALYFGTPGPQVVNVTMSYGLNSSGKPGPLVDYSSSAPQPQDSVYIDTAEAVTNLRTTTLSLQVTVAVGVSSLVISAAVGMATLWDRARRIGRGR